MGGAGDNAAAAVGMGITEQNQSFISLGTSGVFTPTETFLSNAKMLCILFVIVYQINGI